MLVLCHHYYGVIVPTLTLAEMVSVLSIPVFACISVATGGGKGGHLPPPKPALDAIVRFAQIL